MKNAKINLSSMVLLNTPKKFGANARTECNIYHATNSIKKDRGICYIRCNGFIAKIDSDLPQFVNLSPKQLVATFNAIATKE